jgi:precorrin-6B methylase 2
MFSFITEVIGGSADKHIMDEVRSLRREMLTDSRVVRVTDLGAGSTVMDDEERSIRRIASAAALPAREAGLLSGIAASLDSILERVPGQQVCGPQATSPPAKIRNATGKPAGDTQVPDQPGNDQSSIDLLESHSQAIGQQVNDQPGNDLRAARPRDAGQPDNRSIILELGTSLGISTLALALGAPQKKIVTVEGCPELAAIARENLRRHGAANTEVLNMEFSQALAHLKKTGTKTEMAFIDGNHRGKALTEYANTIMRMGEEMIIVADDIRINRDMHKAWQTLATFSFATASLETFRLGMLFCLQNLTPGHYRIRY